MLTGGQVGLGAIAQLWLKLELRMNKNYKRDFDII